MSTISHCTGTIFSKTNLTDRKKCPHCNKCKRYKAHKNASKVYSGLPSIPIPYVQPMYNDETDSCENMMAE